MLGLLGRAAGELRAKYTEVKSDLKTDIEETATRAATWLIAYILFAIAAAFATLAAYQALLADYAAQEATAIIASVYLALALSVSAIAIVMRKTSRAAGADAQADHQPPAEEEKAALVEEGKAELAAVAPEAIADGLSQAPASRDVAPIADLLGSLGLVHEKVALLAASDVAKSLSASELVAGGLAAGFIFGRRLGLARRDRQSPAASQGPPTSPEDRAPSAVAGEPSARAERAVRGGCSKIEPWEPTSG
jgi:hypothetical protein